MLRVCKWNACLSSTESARIYPKQEMPALCVTEILRIEDLKKMKDPLLIERIYKIDIFWQDPIILKPCKKIQDMLSKVQSRTCKPD